MPIEVELKARITDPDTVVGRLRSWADGEVSTYADTYYDFPDRRLTDTGRQELRLRIIDKPTGRRTVWTFKDAVLDNASTPEWETEVADSEAADAILTGLGLQPLIAYTKQCENFRFTAHRHPIVATVVTIPEIDGTFLEIETLISDDTDRDDALKAIHGVLTDLGLTDDDLEPTFYIDLVQAHRQPR
ncbi:class IV adenylate cyclase [Catellatospora chokoriensis]|uniref:Adenylate cyclase n=1 Tax=Catellatospora chokoriensis TaxID=310353 RepID=A0A8J3K0L2_9ACTN|nr:class IV adenylate cyclase [Catellatospora chokoriensis]GIF90503.1 adenylate cyclase [Catellatospora chokoriensis]